MIEHDDTSTPLAFDSPYHVVATGKSESTIDVTWGYLANNGHTGTRLKWEISGEPVGEHDVSATAVRYTLTGLNPNTEYLVRVYGLKNDEESTYSRDAKATTLPATAKPPAPTDLTATPTKDSMALTWKGPANASLYKVSYGVAPNGAVIKELTSTSTAKTVDSLQSGVQYYFDVKSSNNNGDSGATRIVKQTLQVPPEPTGLQATPGVTTAQVQWGASTGATQYVVRYGIEPGGAHETLTTTSLTMTLTDLVKNTLYYIEVSSANGNGESTPARITMRTVDGPPIPDRPGALTATLDFESVRLSWTASIAKQFFEVAYGLASQHPQIIDKYDTEHRTYVLNELSPETRYFAEVRAFNESGYSAPAFREFTTEPDQTHPRNLRVPGTTWCEAWVTWVRPLSHKYLLDYEITCPGRETVHTAELELHAKDLVPAQEYVFTVRQRRTGGRPPGESASISVTTHDRVPPTRAQGIKLIRLAGDNAELSWQPSQDNVGVTGYEVRRNGGAWVPATGTSYAVSELSDDDKFDVRAKDAAGNLSLTGHFIPEIRPPTLPAHLLTFG